MGDVTVNSNVSRDGFTTKWGIIAAAAGSAIGLGNIWKFPYITGIHGGSAFIIVYLVCIVAIGLPIMLSELLIGRRTQKGVIGSFKKLAPKSSWFLIGYMGLAAAFMILAFYGVVAGWTVDYTVKALTGEFTGKSAEQLEGMFDGFIGSTAMPIFWQVIFMGITGLIVVAGIKNGIEKYTKILMPILLVILVMLCVRSVTLPGAGAGLAFLLEPDFSKLSAEGVIAALGHAFFSLSLGMGTLLTYGSYVRKDNNLGNTAVNITFADTFIALLAGVAIFPAVFAFGIEPGAGPGLVFITLPNVFMQMPLGSFFAIAFFVLLAIAALTSSISILEVVTTYLCEQSRISRVKATIIAIIAITALGIPCSLSFGAMSEFKLFDKNFFELLDYISANILLPLGGMLIALFVGWKLKRKDLEDELTNGGSIQAAWLSTFMILVRVVAPVSIAFVFLHGLGLIKL